MSESDVSATLDALERKLRDLERDLSRAGAGPAPVPAVAPSRGEGLDALAAEVDDLGRYRERLAQTSRELGEEYDRVLSRLEALVARPAAPRPPAPPAPAPTPQPAVSDWEIDAGPFADLAALSAFEHRLTGLGAVEVTGFEGRRARLTLRGAREADLAAAGLVIEAPGRARADL